MIKNAFNLKEARIVTAAKKPARFRLSDDILFSSTGKFTDSYRCIVIGKQVKDRYAVSISMTHEPSQLVVHSDVWFFNKQKTCESKFEKIRDIIVEIRDLIETQGMRTIVAQYMIRHSLAEISADVGNVYEHSIPYIRPTIDTSTKGNLFKNMPTIPFTIQTGPDTVPDVYKSTGGVQNPVPKDGVEPPWYYKQVRKDRGMKDVAPAPMSDFQRAALKAGLPLAKTAASGKEVKTGRAPLDAVSEFLDKVEKQSPESVRKGRERSVEHYLKTTGAPEEEASNFYDSVKSLCEDQKVVMEIPIEGLVKFLSEGVYENDEDAGAYNASRERTIMPSLPEGVSPTVTSLRTKPTGKSGLLSVILSKPDDAVFFSGSLDRLRNPSRPDYVEDEWGCLYSPEHAADCRAASLIQAMSISELAAGPARAVEDIASGAKEFGLAEVLVLGPVTPDRISEIIVGNDDDARKVRRIIDMMGKILPVSAQSGVDVVDPASNTNGESSFHERPSAEQLHFQVDDRVALKPRLNNPSIQGSVADVADAKVTIQWDNGDRHVYDAVEALMRLVTQPGEPAPVDGMVVYSLPGMDDETVSILSALGIDPVTIHSMVSHASPVSGSASGWEDVLLKSFEDIGVKLGRTNGYVYQEGPEAFSSGDWLEGRLSDGARLVIDLSPERMLIRAGDVDDYVVPGTRLVFE